MPTITTSATALPWQPSARAVHLFSDGTQIVVYDNGSNYVYRTSSDGATWSAETAISGTGTGVLARPGFLSFVKDPGNDVLYGTVASSAKFIPLKLAYASGAVTVTAAATVATNVGNGTVASVSSCWDATNGMVHIGIAGFNGTGTIRLYGYVASSFAAAVATSSSYTATGLGGSNYNVALTAIGGVVWVFWDCQAHPVTATTTAYTTSSTTQVVASTNGGLGITAGQDTTSGSAQPFFVMSDSVLNKLRYCSYNGTTWSNAILVNAATTGPCVVVVHNATNNNDELWVYYTLTGTQANGEVYLIKYAGATRAWGTATLLAGGDANGHKWPSVLRTITNGVIVQAWQEGTASPYTITDTTQQVGTVAPTDFTLSPSAMSGNPSAASGTFTVSATGTPNSSASIALSAGGAGGTFSPTSVTLTATANPSATFTYTPSATNGPRTVTLTAQASGGMTTAHTATYTVNTASFTATPTTIGAGTPTAIALVGINTAWTGSSTFTPSATGSPTTPPSITSKTNTDATHESVTVDPGSTAIGQTITITGPSGATATLTVTAPPLSVNTPTLDAVNQTAANLHVTPSGGTGPYTVAWYTNPGTGAFIPPGAGTLVATHTGVTGTDPIALSGLTASSQYGVIARVTDSAGSPATVNSAQYTLTTTASASSLTSADTTNVALAVWNFLKSGATAVGSMGALLAMLQFDGSGYVLADAQVLPANPPTGYGGTGAPTVAQIAAGLLANPTTLLANDPDTGGVLPAFDPVQGDLVQGLVANEMEARGYTAARGPLLDNLDTNVGSRLAASAYTPPPTLPATYPPDAATAAEIAAIKDKTDALTLDGSGHVSLSLAQVVTGSLTLQQALIAALTGEGICVVTNDTSNKLLHIYSDPSGTTSPANLVATIPYTTDSTGAMITRKG